MKKRISITIDESVYKKFQQYCKNNSMKMSTKIEDMVRSELQNKR